MSHSDRTRTFQFWLGRAGSGKTYAILDAVAEELRANPRGAPLLILVPEQASAQTEYRLATAPGIGGYTRARVLTFRNLVHQVFDDLGGRPREMIDEETRVLILRRVIGRRRAELQLLGSCADLPGLAASVSQTLLEFARYGWRRSEIESRAALMEEGTLLRAKLLDLALLWEGYEAFLAERGLGDEIAAGEIAAERLRQWPWLDGAKLWIDGFVSFTAQETRLLFALLERVESAALALCLDPDRLFEPAAARIGNERIFENVEKTYHAFRLRLSESGWIGRDVAFPAEEQPTRFSDSRTLAHLERAVLGAVAPERADPEVLDAESMRLPAWPGGPIELIEAEDARAEVTAAASRIAALAAQGVAWSGMAVLARDLEVYAPLIREVFPRHGIPFFLDSPRQLAPHPIARLLAAALHAAAHGFDERTAIDYLKSGLTPIASDEATLRLARFATQNRFSGDDWMAGAAERVRLSKGHPWESEDGVALRGLWQRAAAPALALRAALLAVPDDPAGALWEFIEACGAAAELARWIDALRAEGRHEAAMTHEAAWAQTLELLDRVDRIGPDDSGAAGLLETVEAGLATVRAGLIPPALDQVLAGSVERSRVPEIEAAFVLGLNEGAFPRAFDEDPMLGDLERRELTLAGRDLGPDSVARYSHERFLAYIALTRASRLLYLTRSTAGGAGPSSFFRAVRDAYGLTPKFETAALAPAGTRERPEDWTARAALAFHAARAGSPAQLGQLLAAEPPHLHDAPAAAVETLLALAPERAVQLDRDLVAAWWEGGATLGVTAFETHGRCPFKFFADRMLRLEREIATLPGPAELGTLRHYMLDQLFKHLNETAKQEGKVGVDWGALNLAEARITLADAARRALDPAVPGSIAAQFGRDAVTRSLVELTAREMEHFARALQVMGERYAFRQVASEFPFGGRDGREVSVPTGAGVTFKLRGSVDRVDRLDIPGSSTPILVYDYKSSVKHFNPGLVLAGVHLQLPVYGLVMEQLPGGADKRRDVAGFFYWPLTIGHAEAKGDEAAWAEPGSDAWFKRWRPSGVFRADYANDLDRAVEKPGKALAFNFGLKKDGELTKVGGDWLDPAPFRDLMRAAGEALKTRAEAVARGEIALRPLEQGSMLECERCDARPLCRRDFIESVEPRIVKGEGIRDYRKRTDAPEGTP